MYTHKFKKELINISHFLVSLKLKHLEASKRPETGLRLAAMTENCKNIEKR